MYHIILKSKTIGETIHIQDDLLSGMLTGYPKVFVFHDFGFYHIANLDFIISRYLFPRMKCRIVSFIKGHNPELFKQINYYDD